MNEKWLNCEIQGNALDEIIRDMEKHRFDIANVLHSMGGAEYEITIEIKSKMTPAINQGRDEIDDMEIGSEGHFGKQTYGGSRA